MRSILPDTQSNGFGKCCWIENEDNLVAWDYWGLGFYINRNILQDIRYVSLTEIIFIEWPIILCSMCGKKWNCIMWALVVAESYSYHFAHFFSLIISWEQLRAMQQSVKTREVRATVMFSHCDFLWTSCIRSLFIK